MVVDVRGVQKSRFEAGAGMCCARGAAERIAARSNEMAGRIVCNGRRVGRAMEEVWEDKRRIDSGASARRKEPKQELVR
jgi:hypothetical protein